MARAGLGSGLYLFSTAMQCTVMGSFFMARVGLGSSLYLYSTAMQPTVIVSFFTGFYSHSTDMYKAQVCGLYSTTMQLTVVSFFICLYLYSTDIYMQLTVTGSFITGLYLSKKKKIWKRVDCQHSEKRSRTLKRLKRSLFNWTKHANFWGSPLFQAMYNIKTEKTNNEFTWLVSVSSTSLLASNYGGRQLI